MAAWTAEVSALAVVAATRPHAAYCAFTHGMIGRWIYVMRTVPNIGPLFQPLEDAIRLQFIPAFTGHGSCSMVEREVLSLPCRLGIVNPTIVADLQYDPSTKITNSLKDLIKQQSVTAIGSLMLVLLRTKFIWIDDWPTKKELGMPVVAFRLHLNVSWI